MINLKKFIEGVKSVSFDPAQWSYIYDKKEAAASEKQ